jgi:hypothetical protein
VAKRPGRARRQNLTFAVQRVAVLWWLLAGSALAAHGAQAAPPNGWPAFPNGSLASPGPFCDASSKPSPTQLDRLLQVANIVKHEAERSGHSVGLVSRSGTNLSRFGIRYSHAGLALQGHAQGPWAVRQLYYACEEQRPRVFDQGMSGFLLGTDNLDLGYVSLVMLPSPHAAMVANAAQDDNLAVGLLGSAYSANAHPSSLRFQNCNQWVAELLAAAWGGIRPSPNHHDARVDAHHGIQTISPSRALRQQAQSWLTQHGFAPQPVNVNSHALMALVPFVALIHNDDHPEDDRFSLQFRTSLPAALEALVRDRVPGAQRIEICHDAQRVVVHHGWDGIAPGCTPGPLDRVVTLP